MIAEAALLAALEDLHSGKLRVHEAYRAIRAAESGEGIVLTREEASLAASGVRALLDIENRYVLPLSEDQSLRALQARLKAAA